VKLALVTPAPPLRGGPVQYAAQLYAQLAERGHSVHVIGFRRQYPTWLFPGRTQYEVGGQSLHLPNEPLFDPLAPFSWVRAARRLQQLEPDGVLFQYWMPFFAPGYGAVAWLCHRWTRARVVLLAHNVKPHERQPGGQLLTRWLLAQCDGFLVQSAAVQSELLALRPGAHCARAPHPVHDIFECALTCDEARAQLGLPAGAPVLLFFGHVRPYKGLGVLLDAMARVRRALPAAHLIVAGEFYQDRRPYERQIAALGLAGAVTMVDRFIPREQVGLYFVAADLVALPYLDASQSGIIPIAYYHDRPVIATAAGGLPEQVAEGETGCLVPPRDPDALARAIVRFWTEADRASMAAHIRARRLECTWERLAQAVEKLCDRDSPL